MVSRLRNMLKTLGPGLITGASDNDPAGIGTYSVAGATTGYALLWLALVTIPMMIAVQDMAARIGAIKERGLGAVIRRHYGNRILIPVALIVILVNTVTLGAELEGIGAALELVTGVSYQWFIPPIAIFVLATEIFWSYQKFANYLKWLTLVLFAYVAAGLLAKPDWGQALAGTFIPALRFDSDFLQAAVAVLGTTVSPYMFFWIASEEVEEIEQKKREGEQVEAETTPKAEQRRIIDVASGALVANIVFYFVILSTAATVFATGGRVDNAQQAAQALRPFAGDLAYALFALGLVGGGLLAIPVLAASTAYPVAELFRWEEGLEKKPEEAPGFYGIMVLAVVVGLATEFVGLSPIQVLFYSSVLQGLLAPFLVGLITVMASSPKVIQPGKPANWIMRTLGWLTVALMAGAALAMLWFTFSS